MVGTVGMVAGMQMVEPTVLGTLRGVTAMVADRVWSAWDHSSSDVIRNCIMTLSSFLHTRS
jgi:hypothetical protein